MQRYLAGGLMVAALWTAGCGGDAVEREGQEQTPAEQLSTTADTSEGFQSGAPAPVTPVQGAEGNTTTTTTEQGALTATGNLAGAGSNAPVGSVTLTESGPGSTQVRVKIDRYTPGSRLQASLVAGSCQQPGGTVATVGQPFEVEREGFATLVASVPQPTRALLDGRHSVRVASPGGAGGQQPVLACADLPALQS